MTKTIQISSPESTKSTSGKEIEIYEPYNIEVKKGTFGSSNKPTHEINKIMKSYQDSKCIELSANLEMNEDGSPNTEDEISQNGAHLASTQKSKIKRIYESCLRKRSISKHKQNEGENDQHSVDIEFSDDSASSRFKSGSRKKRIRRQSTVYNCPTILPNGRFILNTINLFDKKDLKGIEVKQPQIEVDQSFGNNIFENFIFDPPKQLPTKLEIVDLLQKMHTGVEDLMKEVKLQNASIMSEETNSADLTTQRFLSTLQTQRDLMEKYKDKLSYINCDVRYYNFEYLAQKIGSFDVIMMDPPWRIKGGQKNDSQFMFSNSTFCLEYNTMSNEEIRNLQIEKLSKKGFIFLWILANQISEAAEMMNKWGYDLVDMIIWVKVKDSKIYLSHGYYFMHSYEICLVGYKCPLGEHVEYYSKVSNNILFAEVQSKSQKPKEMYDLIELMMPGSKKIEIFARNNNLRPGWMALGNQLGPQFNKWINELACDKCKKNIHIGSKRFKSKIKTDYDLCQRCFDQEPASHKDTFFELLNNIDEDVLHQYHTCDNCSVDPIWGVRFQCTECEEFDLCEACFDKQVSAKDPLHMHKTIAFKAFEVPILAGGFPTHMDSKCASCFQKPIIGVAFKCSECKSFNLCQNCYFTKFTIATKNVRGHKKEHSFGVFLEGSQITNTNYCKSCELSIEDSCYRCDNCFDFHLCEGCYSKRKHIFLGNATSHKSFHRFTKVS